MARKKESAFGLFVKERGQQLRRLRRRVDFGRLWTDLGPEWESLPKCEQNTYRFRSKEMNHWLKVVNEACPTGEKMYFEMRRFDGERKSREEIAREWREVSFKDKNRFEKYRTLVKEGPCTKIAQADKPVTPKHKQQISLSNLPVELVRKIMEDLDEEDVESLQRTCRRFKNLKPFKERQPGFEIPVRMKYFLSRKRLHDFLVSQDQNSLQ